MNHIVLKDNESTCFELIKYPDGQKNIRLNLDTLNIKLPVSIKCRIKNFDELEVLLCLVSALRKKDFYIQEIIFVYLFGMRSDRSFEDGQPNYFRDVVAPIINSMTIPQVYIFCPHSESSFRSIKNVFHHRIRQCVDYTGESTLIWGDESSPRLTACISMYVYCYFIKTRQENNIIVSLSDNAQIFDAANSITIVDDLCDAGGTFIAEAKYLRETGINIPLKLWVAHGLFTKGVDVLLEHFDEIICTNSYQDIAHPKVIQIKVI